MRQLLPAKANRVDRYPLAADFIDGGEVHPACIVGTIAEQHHRANRKAGGFPGHLFQIFTEVG